MKFHHEKMRLIKISMALVVFFTVVYVADGFPFWRGKPAYLNIKKWKYCTDEAIAAPGMNGQTIFPRKRKKLFFLKTPKKIFYSGASFEVICLPENQPSGCPDKSWNDLAYVYPPIALCFYKFG